MPVNMTEWSKFWYSDATKAAWEAHWNRWHSLTPAQRKKEYAESDARWEAARKHIAFLDYCAANKIKPGLVLPVNPNK